MKLHYYAETDSLYVELKGEPGTETREVSDGLNVDWRRSMLPGMSSDSISTTLRLGSTFQRSLEVESLPVRSYKVG